jgi:septum formation protein
MQPVIYLASQSPRRHQLLQQLGVGFEPIEVTVEECWNGSEPPRKYTARLALDKARAGHRLCEAQRVLPVLGADTAVVIDDDILGKPDSNARAFDMLGRLAGRCHQVYSAVALVGESEQIAVSVSRVHFRPLSGCERQSYVNTGEPIGKAGAYAIQGLAAAFINQLEGSYSGVMGLPLYETTMLLTRAGISVFSRS